MAITPTEATRRARPDTAELKRLETMIDEEIVSRMRKVEAAITFDIEIFPDHATRTAIIDSYRTAGWNVTYNSDWRDGDYISIAPRKGNYDFQSHGTIDDYR